jgi:putative (di)nucleoside polyphosphate hydrolase
MDLAPYRPNVGVVLARSDGKVWLGRRANTPGPYNWQFPQGGVDPGETPLQAATRELCEETGVRSVRLLGQTADWIAYRFPPEHAGAKIAKGWIGQKQLWFAFRFLGDESEIDLNAHPEIEFDSWRWAEFAEAPNLVVPFKQEVYRQVLAALRPLIDR